MASEFKVAPYFEIGIGDGGESLEPNVDELSIAANDGVRGIVGIMIYPSGSAGNYRLSLGYGLPGSSDDKNFGPSTCSIPIPNCARQFDAERRLPMCPNETLKGSVDRKIWPR